MFFLWGILIATPIVAGTILAVIWFGQLLIAPLASGDVHRIPWNRPSLFLGLITTSISAVVAGYSLGNALYDWVIPDFLFVVMNVSAAFLVTNVLVVATECLTRRAVTAMSLLVFVGIPVVAAAMISFVIFGSTF